MMILNSKHSHVFRNEDRISSINSGLFSFKVAGEDVNSVDSTVLDVA